MNAMNARRSNGTRARCQHEGCEKFAQTRGLCKAHGGGSRCRDTGCTKLAQSRGLCIAHGGGRRCQNEGCTKLAQSKGFCISHGGGRRCIVPSCDKFSQVKGRCKSHSKLVDADNEVETESDPESMGDSPRHDRPCFVRGVQAPRTSSPSLASSVNAATAATAKLSIDFLVNPPQTAAQAAHSTFGSVSARPMLLMVGNNEGQACPAHNAEVLGRRASVERLVDPLKRIPSITPRHDEEEIRPLPFAYQRPAMTSQFHHDQGVHDPFFIGRPTSLTPNQGMAFSYPPKPMAVSLLSFLDRPKEAQVSETTRAWPVDSTQRMPSLNGGMHAANPLPSLSFMNRR